MFDIEYIYMRSVGENDTFGNKEIECLFVTVNQVRSADLKRPRNEHYVRDSPCVVSNKQ